LLQLGREREPEKEGVVGPHATVADSNGGQRRRLDGGAESEGVIRSLRL